MDIVQDIVQTYMDWDKGEEKSVLDFIDVTRAQKQAGVTSGQHADYWDNLQSWVYACVDKRAKAVAESEFRLVVPDPQGRQKVLVNHPIYKLLKNPNDYMSAYDLFYITAGQMDTVGNAYWWLQPSMGTHVISIHPLFPDYVKIYYTEDGKIAYYTYEQEGNPIPIRPEQIIHFKNPNPQDPKLGCSVLKKAQYPIDANILMGQTTVSILDNQSIPPGILTTDQALRKEDVEKLQFMWEDRYRGAGKAGHTAVLHKGLKYQAIVPELEQLMFKQGKILAREEICAIFQVPVALLGLVEDVNRANADYLERHFLNKTIKPILRQIKEPLNRKLLPRYAPVKMAADFYLQLPRDAKTEAEVHQIYFNTGVLNQNEIREQVSLPPRDGGDTYYVHSGVLPEGESFTPQEPGGENVGHTPGVGTPARGE